MSTDKEYFMSDYKPKWWECRLPFNIVLSLSVGSTMFDFAFWDSYEIISIGVFWVHLEILIFRRRR